MKSLMLGTAMALVLGTASSAQDLFRTEMDPIAIAASDFIGKRVYAAEAAVDADEYAGVQEGWNDIGEINDVILTRDGRVDAVLVDVGGFLGMGERQVALGMENIRFVSDSATAEDLSDFFLVVNADRTIIEGAPEYKRMSAMPMGTDGTGVAAAPADADSDATMTDGTATAEANTDAGTVDGAMAVEGYAAVERGSITSEQLMGVRVYGPKDEDLGEISDLVLDAKGAPLQVIVDVGGFLGMGEKPVALELSQLQILQATEGGMYRAYIQMTQEQLETLPAAKK